MTVKLNMENGTIQVTSPYDQGFIKAVKGIGGRWNASCSTWDVPEENKELLKPLLLKYYGWTDNEAEIIKIKYRAEDFVDNNFDAVAIGNVKMVTRRYRDKPVTYLNSTVVIDGGFPESGGSARYPKPAPLENTTLCSEISKAAYDQLGEDEKSKIQIVKEASKKEKLESEKEKIMARLKEIDAELASL